METNYVNSPIEANKPNQSPSIRAQTNEKSPILVTNTDLPVVVEPAIEAQIKANDNQRRKNKDALSILHRS
jgi:hypothetical protein